MFLKRNTIKSIQISTPEKNTLKRLGLGELTVEIFQRSLASVRSPRDRWPWKLSIFGIHPASRLFYPALSPGASLCSRMPAVIELAGECCPASRTELEPGDRGIRPCTIRARRVPFAVPRAGPEFERRTG